MKLWTASLDNWQLAVLDISDTVSQNLVQHEYLHTDGADIQSMGAKARTVKFRTFWFGTDFNLEDIQISGAFSSDEPPEYKNHFDFVNYLSSNRRGEEQIRHTLVHPKYGLIHGFVSDFTVTHDDTQDYCSIDINFVQDEILDKYFPTAGTSIDISEEYIKQLNDLIADTGNSIKSAGNGKVLGIPLNRAINFVNQINIGLTTTTRTFISEVESNLAVINAFHDEISDLSNTVDNAVNYIGDVPSEIIGGINRSCNRLFRSLVNVASTPVKFYNSAIGQLIGLGNTLTGTYKSFFQQRLMSVSAVALISEASKSMIEDQTDRARANAAKAFDLNGNRTTILPVEILMTRNDMESILYQIQIYVQDSLELDRNQPQLRLAMGKLNNYVRFNKLNLLTTKTITVSNIPLHALLCKLGQNYELADQVLAMNPHVKNPAFCDGEMRVYASA